MIFRAGKNIIEINFSWKIGRVVLRWKMYIVALILFLLALGIFSGYGMMVGQAKDGAKDLFGKDIEKLPRVKVDEKKVFKGERKDFQIGEDPEFEIEVPVVVLPEVTAPEDQTGEGTLGNEENGGDRGNLENQPTQPPVSASETFRSGISPSDIEADGEGNLDLKNASESFKGVLEDSGDQNPTLEPSSGAENLLNVLPEKMRLDVLASVRKNVFSFFQKSFLKIAMAAKKNKKVDYALGKLAKIFRIEPASAQSLAAQVLKAEIFNANGEKVDIVPLAEEKEGKLIVRVPKPERSFRPGKYQIEVEILKGEQIAVATQDFSWGVLAINFNKSIYSPKENAKISMAVLDNSGKMVCDAKLELRIENRDLGIDDLLSTEDGTIKINSDVCNSHDFTLTPDYEAEYKTGEWGKYEMTLTAETASGTHIIKDGFEVSNLVAFDVERTSATRIYPVNRYPVTLGITANQDFEGTVQEKIPSNFTVLRGEGEEAKKYQPYDEVKTDGETRTLTWNLSIKKGDKVTLGYQFDAPHDSPQFYLLGPLRFKVQTEKLKVFKFEEIVFAEARQWQIAADAPGTINFTGFEVGEAYYEAQTSATQVTLQTSTVRTGTYAIRVNASASATYARMRGYAGTGLTAQFSYATAYYRFYFQHRGAPGVSEELFAAYTSAASPLRKMTIRLNSSSQLEAYSQDGTTLIGTSSSTVAANQWYRIEAKVGTGSSAAWEVKINGVSEMSGSTANLATVNNGEVRFGMDINRNTATVDFFYDDINIRDDAYPGPGRVRLMRPDGDSGTLTAGTSGGGTPKWNVVDEVPPNEATDYYITSGVIGAAYAATLASSTNSTITGTIKTVKSFGVVARAGTNNDTIRLLARSNGTGTTAATTLNYLPTATYLPLARIFDTNLDGGAWTTGNLDDLEVGARTQTVGSTNRDRFTVFYAMVDYDPGVTISGTIYQAGSETLTNATAVTIAGSLNNNTAATVPSQTNTFRIAVFGGKNDDVALYIQGHADLNANTIFTLSSDEDVGGVPLMVNKTVIDGGTASPSIANTDVCGFSTYPAAGDNTFTCSGGVPTYNGDELHIDTGSTYAPGGTVNTAKMHVAGTYTGASETLTLSGSGTGSTAGATDMRPLFVSGTFTTPATTKFTGSSASYIESLTYGNLQFLPASGTPTYTPLSGTLATANTYSLTMGDSTYNVAVAANTNNPTINIGGGLSIGSGSSFTESSNTLTFNATSGGPYTWADANSTKSDMGAISINGTSLTINLGSSVKASTVSIAGSQTLGLGSSGYTLEIVGTGAAATVLTVTGTLSPGTSSTVKYTAVNSGGSVNVATTTYNSLDVSPTATETYVLTGNLTSPNNLTGGLNIGSNATLDTTGTNYNITLAGNWANSGVFTANSGTVTLNSTTATQSLSGTMTGSSAFYNLVITNNFGTGASDDERTSFVPGVDFNAAAKTSGTFTITTASVKVEYESAQTFEFTNVNWNGQDAGTRIYFRSSVAGSGNWLLKVPGTQTSVAYVNVSRSDASTPGGPAIDASVSGTSYDGGNNPNWIFIATITVSGTSVDESSGTVWVAVNNAVQSGKTGTITGAGPYTWSISSVVKPSAGAIITVWINSAADADESTAIGSYSGSGSMTDMVLNRNVLSIGGVGSQSVSVANLCNASYNYDNGDNEDIMHTCSSSTLTVDGHTPASYDYEKIDILSGDTLAVGNSEVLTTYDLTITGTLTSGTLGTFNVSHNWTNNGTTFTASTSTVNMNGSTTQTINGSTQTAFNSLTDSNTGAELVVSTSCSFAGILTVNASAVLNPGAAVVISGGTGTLTGSGTAKVSYAAGSNAFYTQYTINTKTLTNLTVDYTGNTGSGLVITDTIYGNAGSGGLKISGTMSTGTQTATVAGVFTVTGTFTPSGGTITMNNGSSISNSGSLTFQALTIANSATVTTSTNFNVAGTFTINGSAIFYPDAAVVLNSAGEAGTITGTGTARVTRTDATPDYSSQYKFTTNTLTSLTVDYYSASAQTVSAVNYGNLASSNSGDRTLASSGAIGISGTFTIGGSSYTTTGSTVDYNGAGQTVGAINYNNLTLSGSGTKTLQTGTTTVGGNMQISGTAAATTVVGLAVNGNLTVSGGSLTTAGYSLTVTGTTTVNGGTLTLDNNTGTKLLTGAVAVSSGTLNGASTAIEIRNGITQSSSGSVAITGTASFTTTASQSLNGTIGLGATTIGLGVTMTNNGTTTISGTLTLTGNWAQANGSTLNYSSTSAFSGAGTFSASTATNTVNYTASGTQTVKDPDGGTAHTYNNLTLSGTSAKTMTGVTNVSGNFTLSGTASATLDGSLAVAGQATVNTGTTLGLGSSGYTLTLSGSGTGTSRPLYVNGGTLNAGTNSTVRFTGGTAVANTEIEGTSNGGAITYNNLEIFPAATGASFRLGSAGSQTMNISGNFTVNDGSGTETVSMDWDNFDPYLTVGGNLTMNDNITTWTKSIGVRLTFSGTTTPVTWTDYNSSKKDIGNVWIGDATNTKHVDLGSAVKVTTLVVKNNGTFDHNGSNNLNLNTNLALDGGVPGSNYVAGGIVYLDGASTNDVTDANTVKKNLGTIVVDGAANDATYGTDIVATKITIGADDHFGSSGVSLTLTGSGAGTSRPLRNLNSDGGYWLGPTYFTGTGDTEIEGAAGSSGPYQNAYGYYEALYLQPASGTPTYYLGSAASQHLEIEGDLVVGSGSDTVTANWTYYDPELDVYGDLILASGGSWTKSDSEVLYFANDSGNFSPTSDWSDANGTKQDIGNVIVGEGTYAKTVNLGSAVDATKVEVKTSAVLALGSSGYTLTLTGSGTGTSRPLYMNGGSLTEGTNSTVRFAGTGATDIQNETFYHLELSPSGGSTPTYTLMAGTIASQNLTIGNGTNGVAVTAATNNPTLDINGDFVLNKSSSFAGGTQSITVGTDGTTDGDFTLEYENPAGSAWTAGSGTLILDGGDDSNLVYFNDKNPIKQNMGSVQIGQSPATTNLSSDMSATNLTIASGDRLNTRGYDITLTDYLTVNGTGILNVNDSAETDDTFITLGGNFTMSGTGTFSDNDGTPFDSEIVFTGNASADQLFTTGGKTYGRLTLNNDEGTYDDIDVTGNLDLDSAASALTITDGNLDLAAYDPSVYIKGNVSIASAGSWTKQDTGSPLVTFDGSSTTFSDSSSGGPQDIGLVTIGPSTATTLATNTAMKATKITVNAGDTFDITGDTLTLTGTGTGVSRPLYNNGGTFTSASSTVIHTGSGSNTDVETVAYNNLTFTPGSATTYYLKGNLTSSNAMTGNLTINSNATLDNDSGSKYSLTLGGSWSNSGTFTHNSGGTVTFNSGDTGETINSGGTSAGKTFYNVVFNNSSGGWTIQTNNLTADSNFTITDTNNSAGALTVDSVTVEVKGTYSVENAETSNTAWTSATLYLNSGTAYTIGTINQNTESYSTLHVGGTTDIRMWKSSAAAYTIDSGGSLYSMKHAAAAGDAYVWGDFHTASHEYWDYNYDFDGTDISGSPRDAVVKLASGATVTVDAGDTLEAIGAAGHLTAVDWQSAGGYNIVNATGSPGGTINFQYASLDHLKGNKGIDVQTGSLVTGLSNVQFDNLVNAGADDAFIYVQSAVIVANPRTFTNCQFANTGSYAEFNVNRTGTDDLSKTWNFTGTVGAFGIETEDAKDGVGNDEGDPGMIVWPDSISEIFTLSCADAAAMANYTLGNANNYNEKDFTAGEKCTVTDTGHAAAWTLTLQSTNLTGVLNNLSNTNIKLSRDGNPASAPTVVSSTTGITEPAAGNYALDSIQTIIQGAEDTASGTYDVQIRARLESLNNLRSENDDMTTLTFTLS